MRGMFHSERFYIFKKFICLVMAWNFVMSVILLPVHGQETLLPAPGAMVWLSSGFEPIVLKGLTIHPQNPFLLDFIVDRGQDRLSQDTLKSESAALVKYFLTALTVPDKESWVNLSPYEKDRIIPDSLGSTEMGKQMLEQDYLLKQLSSSLTNPDKDLGKKFWSEVKKRAGGADVAVSTFNKVWIVPGGATVAENNGAVFVTQSHLKVMLEQDYVALQNNVGVGLPGPVKGGETPPLQSVNKLSTDVFREIVLPQLEKEINEGRNFAATRQVYQSVILAAWYKKVLKESLLGKVYVDQGKVAGVNIEDKSFKTKVYEQYLEAFKKGVYSIIKEESSVSSEEVVPKKYFSGGLGLANVRLNTLTGNSAFRAVQDFSARLEGRVSRVAVQLGVDPLEVGAIQSASSTVTDTHQPLYGIGISMGGTKIGAALMNQNGEIVKKTQRLWRQQYGDNATDESIVQLLRDIITELTGGIDSFYQVQAIKIGFAGPLDEATGRVGVPFHAPNLPFNNFPLAERIKTVFSEVAGGAVSDDLKVAVKNDAHAAALGETKNGWIFILGTGANGAAVKDGEIYTDQNALLELGHNILLKRQPDGSFKWTYRGRMMRGDKSSKADGEKSIEDLFSGPGLARQFVAYIRAQGLVSSQLPMLAGVKDVDTLFTLIPLPSDKISKEQQVLRDQGIFSVLQAITQAVEKNDPLAIEFVKSQGEVLGNAFASLAKVYADESWIDNLILVSGVGESFARVQEKSGDEDIFIHSIRIGLKKSLLEAGISEARAEKIAQGIRRSDMDWRREVLWAAPTPSSGNSSSVDQSSSSSVNTETKVANPVGGIDFDPSKLNLQIKRNVKGIPLPLPQQDLKNIHINGLFPVIINIQPVMNVSTILGWKTDDAQSVDLSKS